MKRTLLTLLLCGALLCGCSDIDVTDTDASDTDESYVLEQSFGEYDYYIKNEYYDKSRIMRGDDIIFEGSGTFREAWNFPVFEANYPGNGYTIFDTEFTPIIKVEGYREISGRSILAYRGKDAMCELLRIDADGSVLSLGEFTGVCEIVSEGDFALVITSVQNESLSSEPYNTLTVVDRNGDILAYLDEIDPSASFLEPSGSAEEGKWIFTFFVRNGGDMIFYHYHWNWNTGSHRLEIEYPITDGYSIIPRKDDTTDYLAVTETYAGVDCLFLDGDIYKCRRIRVENNSVFEGVYGVERWDKGTFEGYRVLVSYSARACWGLDSSGTVVFDGCGTVSEIGGFPVFWPYDVQLPETFLTHDFKILCEGVTDFEIEEGGDIIARKADRLVRIGKDETVTDIGEYDGRFDDVIHY